MQLKTTAEIKSPNVLMLIEWVEEYGFKYALKKNKYGFNVDWSIDDEWKKVYDELTIEELRELGDCVITRCYQLGKNGI